MTGEVVVCGLGLGLGIVGVVRSLRGKEAPDPAALRTRPTWSAPEGMVLRLTLAGAIGVAAGMATGWLVAIPIAGAAVYGLPKLFGKTAASTSIATIEAIATWTEMLQGTMAASAGLGQAIIATAPLSPRPIRGATTQLAARLQAGMHPRDALFQFADELEDPCADRVVCALQMAVTSRAQRLGELLAALADSTRDEVALRLRIETSRASVRSGVRTVLVFSVAFALVLVVAAHAYLSPYGSHAGQMVLAGVGLLYGLGLTLMVALARPPAPVRLLGRRVEVQ